MRLCFGTVVVSVSGVMGRRHGVFIGRWRSWCANWCRGCGVDVKGCSCGFVHQGIVTTVCVCQLS